MISVYFSSHHFTMICPISALNFLYIPFLLYLVQIQYDIDIYILGVVYFLFHDSYKKIIFSLSVYFQIGSNHPDVLYTKIFLFPPNRVSDIV